MGLGADRYFVIIGIIFVVAMVFIAADMSAFGTAINPYRWYIAVLVFGGGVGASELIGRYRDAPFSTLRTGSAMFYAFVNALTAVAAFWLIRRFDVRFGLNATDKNLQLVQAMVAGFGSMAFFRSSLFTVKIGSADVQVGPGVLFQVLLFAADRACDRQRSRLRTELIAKIMDGVSFNAAKVALPNFCFDLMQNLPAEEAQRVKQAVDALSRTAEMRDADRVLSLGLVLMNVVGSVVLTNAVRSLGPRLQEPAKIELNVFTKLQGVRFDRAWPILADICFVMSRFGTQDDRVQARREVENEMAGVIAAGTTIDNDTRVLMLALALQRRVGDGILEAALIQLGDSIRAPTPRPRRMPPAQPTRGPQLPLEPQPPAGG